MSEQNNNALFLGPKSENHKFFREMLDSMMDEHIFWRRDFHPDDLSSISHSEQRSENFCTTIDRVQEALYDLSNKLKTSSVPWFSTRYLGHMNTDILIPGVIGYMAGILYNPNNCAYEGAPATTGMELEVGEQLGIMLGYDPEKTWGHITSGGTVANYEALWHARNLKSVPLAVKEVSPEFIGDLDEWQLLNFSTEEILELIEKLKKQGLLADVLQKSVRGKGVKDVNLGRFLIPQSRHYSWDKAVDIFGIGSDNLIPIQVKDDYRMDIDALKSAIDDLVSKKIPILGVVSVVGTTEEGAVDEIHKVVELREHYSKKGINFYYHIDAAYGGYVRTVFLDEDNKFIEYDSLVKRLSNENFTGKHVRWPSENVYKAFKAMPNADTITLDCHKMGYIPYPAGALAVKDKRILDIVTYKAAYVEGKGDPVQLGPFIMEGSKAGAAAGAVWVTHRAVPLNITGYGKIIACSIEGADYFYKCIKEIQPFVAANGKTYTATSLTTPDFNVVVFAFNEVGNTNLEKMNELNERIYNRCSYVSGPVYQKRFITSKTILTEHEYGDVPKLFVEKLSIPEEEWKKIKNVYVLRACIMSPFLANNTTFREYWGRFIQIMKDIIGE